MVARLTVIISQSSQRDRRAAEAEESLLAELLMAPGLDATLVGCLEQMEPESTDHLCLSGFTNSVALVSWLTAEQVAMHWQRLQLGGQVIGATQAEAAPAGNRRVHCLSLASGLPLLLSQLKQLLSDRRVQTFSLGLPPASPASPSSPTDASKTASERPPIGQPAPPLSKGAPQPPATASAETKWSNLDELVDEFDLLDL
ncbi:MAG: hypothetical protein KDA45_04900 [Planctomycetales bacterium]|nr:hypothetical protein [Planctomycetales bacterium]